ncbi:MAG: serine/threonine protein kinase, partial [Deltaproteobacteria bacterium]
MKRPTQSRPFTGSGLSRPTPSRAVPRPETPPAAGDRALLRGGAAASPRPTAEDVTLPAATAEDLGLPARDEKIFAGRYRIEKKLGRGGMGSVFLATQLIIDRKVAIKVLENVSEDGVMVARFQREARVIAKLQHPNIVNLIDFGESEHGQLFLVMEYIDGEPLTSLVKREAPLDPTRVVRIALQITEALAAAHDINVIHRDLKPDNIMMVGSTLSDYVKILDFGIAKVKRTDPGQDTVQTRAGLIVGSLRYISPEQVESKEVTFQTDFYALGGILYELLCGHLVFDYASPADCAIAHLTEPPKPPTLGGVPLTGPLVDLIMQCLEKDPARRPPSAHKVIAMLRAAERAPIHQRVHPAAQDEIPTDEHRDVHHGATHLDLGAHQRLPTAPTQPPAAPPLSRPISRPMARPAQTAGLDPAQGYGPRDP